MNCYSVYEGKKFNSDVELDDFLIATQKFNKSDVVYDTSTNSQAVTAATAENFVKQYKKEKLEGRFKKSTNKSIDGGDKIQVTDSNAKGVTDFLSGLMDANGKYLFPEFRPDDYWGEQFKKWKSGVFTLDEIEYIFDGGKPENLSQQSCEYWRKQYEEKWEAQAKIGTSIHSVLQFYFNKIKTNRNLTSQQVHENIKKYFQKDIQNGYITDEKIIKAIDYAKALDAQLQVEFPEAIYYPEFVIKGEANSIDGSPDTTTLIGMIDLLVVDKAGAVHIIDYKTSPLNYEIRGSKQDPNPLHGYSSAKINAFKYQLATYKRILTTMGFNTSPSRLYVAPIQLENFRKNENGLWDYSSFKEFPGFIDQLLQNPNEATHVLDRLQDIFYLGDSTNITADDLMKDLNEFMQEVFPKISIEDNTKTMEECHALIVSKGADKPADNGKYYWKPKMDSNVEISADSLEKLTAAVYSYYKKLPEKRHTRFDYIVNAWNEATKDQQHIDMNASFGSNTDKVKEDTKPDYVDNILRRYLNPNWELMQNDAAFDQLKELGILRFKNNTTQQIDCVMVTSNLPAFKRQIVKGRSLLTGRYETDIIGKNRDELVLDSTYGNIDLIKMMFVVNKLPDMFKNSNGENTGILGRMLVINPDFGEGLTADNAQILNNFNFLMRNAGEKFRKSNYFSTQNKGHRIKVATNLDMCKNRIAEVLAYNDSQGRIDNIWRRVNTPISELDNIGMNPELIRIELLKIKEQFEKETTFTGLKNTVRSGIEVSNSDPHIETYNYLLKAISECDGFFFKQQLQDHSKWFEGSLSQMLSKGWTGTYVDNPGTTASEVLNDSTRLVTRAYQNIREDMGRTKDVLRKLVQDFKDEVNFGYFKERLGGNMASIYKNMYEERNGDLFFVNPDTAVGLGKAGRDLLRYSLEQINRNRYKKETESEEDFAKRMELWKTQYPDKYYKVPILRGSTQSMLSTRSLLDVIKYKLSRFTPENLKRDFVDLVEGIVDPNEQSRRQKSEDLWNMCNIFEISDSDNSTNRKELIKYYSGIDSKGASEEVRLKAGISNIERNLETLVFKHTFAYSQAKHINYIMPNLKAIMSWLKMSEVIVNTPKGFAKDIQYLQDYIKNKVLGRSLNPENYRVAEIAANKLMSVASKMALGFNPVQLYQNIEHLFKSISLVIRKPDGTDAFTLKNMTESIMYTYQDLARFGNGKSKSELLNELYAFNDMDTKVYVDRIQSDITGFWHFWTNLCFRMSSRPDFYNRMSIFGAQMRNDGCWEAHTVENGVLKYKWKQDKRFNQFAAGNTKHPEYNKQKAMYYTLAKQLVEEGAYNADGTKFKISSDPLNPTDLPKAYSSDQIEGYKSLSNTLYGYYTTENKSLMQSLGLGALWFQMYTYISGKKNQYLSPSRISQLKYMEQYKDENGQLYYVKLDENGMPTSEITTEETPLPYMVWKGRFTEGVLLTLSRALKLAVIDSKGDISKGFKNVNEQMFGENVDENIKTAYRANLQQLVYDIAIFSVVGKLIAGSMNAAVADYAKNNKVDGFGEGLSQIFLKYNVDILEHATRDFNFLDSIFGRTLDWNPFAISILTKTVGNISEAFTGNESLVRQLLKSASATRQWKPIWDYYIPKPEKED